MCKYVYELISSLHGFSGALVNQVQHYRLRCSTVVIMVDDKTCFKALKKTVRTSYISLILIIRPLPRFM